MNSQFRLLIWAIFYGMVAYFQYTYYLQFEENLTVAQFVGASLFNMQQFFFVVTVFFLSFLYCIYRPITSPMVVVRSGKLYFRKQLVRLFKCCGSFWVFVLILYISLAVFRGSPFDLSFMDSWSLLRFFLGLCILYLIYLTLLLLTQQPIFSLIGTMIFNIVLSAILLMGAWVTFDLITGEVLEDTFTPRSELALNLYPLVGIFLMVYVLKKCKRGDFL